MEGRGEDVRLGANKYRERQAIETAAQTQEEDVKDYKEPPPAPLLFEPGELSSLSFYRAGIAEFVATFLFLQILAPLSIGFAVFLLHLAAIPITGTGINTARSLGATVIYNKDQAWDDHWIFWAGPFIGAALAAFISSDSDQGHPLQVIRAIPFKSNQMNDQP